MSRSAYVLARTGSRWRGDELDLHAERDLDEVADLMRDAGDGGTVLLFLEEDDEYVAIVRVDGDDDPRGFISDARCLDAPTVAGAMFDGALEVAAEIAALDEVEGEDALDDDEESEAPEIEPAGDAALLTDLGVGEADLLGFCAEEGMLPADVITAISEKIGCLDELERVRGL